MQVKFYCYFLLLLVLTSCITTGGSGSDTSTNSTYSMLQSATQLALLLQNRQSTVDSVAANAKSVAEDVVDYASMYARSQVQTEAEKSALKTIVANASNIITGSASGDIATIAKVKAYVNQGVAQPTSQASATYDSVVSALTSAVAVHQLTNSMQSSGAGQIPPHTSLELINETRSLIASISSIKG